MNKTEQSEKTAVDFLNEKLSELDKSIADYNELLEVGKKELLRGAFGFTKDGVATLEEKIAAFELEKLQLIKAIESVTPAKPESKEESQPSLRVRIMHLSGDIFYSPRNTGDHNNSIMKGVEKIEALLSEQLYLHTQALAEENERLRKENEWISVEDRLPELIDGRDYSENVLAIDNGKLKVFSFCYIREGDGYYGWANCYGNIEGDGEFDDDYQVTHWRPLPSPPTISKEGEK